MFSRHWRTSFQNRLLGSDLFITKLLTYCIELIVGKRPHNALSAEGISVKINLIKLLIYSSVTISSSSLFSQIMPVNSCSMIIVRPWQSYQPGNYGGGAGPAVSENAAIEFWTNQFISEGFPREIFNVSCTYQGSENEGPVNIVPL